MRIERLNLVRYGHFTDCALDFGAPGLHLVVGPNEAGKSTLRSAVGELLYGIHPQTKLDFLHAMQDLRIDALLRGADGTTLDVVRLKKTKDSLRTADDAALPQGVLDGLLAGIDKKTFGSVFALDHEELRAGGQALLDGKGDLGEALFESRSSARLSRVQEQLREQYKALYTSRGRHQPLNTLLGAAGRVAEAKREREAALLDPRVYKKLTDDVAEARKQVQRLQESLNRERTELNRLMRIRQAYPAVEQRRRLLEERGSLLQQGTPAPGHAGRAYAAIVEGRKTHQLAAKAARGELARIDEKLADLAERAKQLEFSGEALEDSEDAGFEHAGVEYAARLRALIERVEELRESRRDAQARLDAAKSAANKKNLDLTKRQAALEKLRAPRNTAPLRAALKAVPEGLTTRIESTRKQLASATSKLAAERKRHARFALPEQLGDLAVPGEQEMQAAVKRIAEAEHRAAECERLRDEQCAREREGRRVLERFLQQDPPPSEADLAKARERRGELWKQVRARWSTGAVADTDDSGRSDRSNHEAVLADFESALAAADETADRMRREAQRLAERKNLEQAVQEAAARIAELDEELARARAEHGGLLAGWDGLWEASALPAPSPDAAADFMRAFQRIRELSEEVARQEADLADDEATAEAHVRRLRELLASTYDEGEADSADAATAATGLAELRALAEERQAALTEAARKHATALTQVADLRAEAAEAERDLNEKAQFIASLDTYWADFLATHALEGAPLEVRSRLESALKLTEERNQLLEGREEHAAALAAGEEQLEQTAADLARLLTECGVADEQLLKEAIALRTSLDGIDAKLEVAVSALTGQGASVEQLEREVADQDLGRLDALISEGEQAVAEQESANNTKSIELARLEHELAGLNGSAKAAEKAEVVEQELAAVVGHGHEYLRLYLAERLLLENIEAYRQQHQGPVLRRAQEAFTALTEGRFVQLVDDTGTDGKAVLRARRAPSPGEVGDGQLVDVEGMSEGTRDQLYLALRLATLERYAEEGRAMPLLLDDVLMTFDDGRSAAALRVFDDLAERFQVILLTHHAHLIEVAAAALPSQRLHVHRVGAQA